MNSTIGQQAARQSNSGKLFLHLVQDGDRMYLKDANGVFTGILWDGRMIYGFYENCAWAMRPWPKTAAWRWDFKQKKWRRSSPVCNLVLHLHPLLTWENQQAAGMSKLLGAPRIFVPEKRGIFSSSLFEYRPGEIVCFDKDNAIRELQELHFRREAFALVDAAIKTIPEKIRNAVRGYTNENWLLLKTAGQYPDFADLLASNPALATVFANRSKLKTRTESTKKGEYAKLLRQKQRTICGFFGFGNHEWVVTLLKKMSPSCCNLMTLDNVRYWLHDPVAVEKLRHVHEITYPVMNFFSTPLLRQAVTGKFLNELAENYPDFDHGVFYAAWEPVKLLEEQPHGHTMDDFYSVQSMAWHVLNHNHSIRLDSLVALEKKYAELFHGSLKRLPLAGWADFPPPPVEGTPDIIPILSASELFEEGKNQHHCVANYEKKVIGGRLFFYRLLQPERATISVRRRGARWFMDHVKLNHNQEPQPETIDFVERWLEGNCNGCPL
ncbi:MAG: PcfJ domain-containing protein [Chlorobium sp.]|nr:PcfJ domain-containing protein [Chlorobium sp.]